MFTPDPPPGHRLLPPDWFVAQFNATRPWGEPPRTRLDPQYRVVVDERLPVRAVGELE